MSFGLSSAPFLFSKVMEEVLNHLRTEFKINIYFYLDDIIIFHLCEKELRNCVEFCLKFFDDLGLTICRKKSVLFPVQSIEYLGVTLNLSDESIQLKRDNRIKCISKAKIGFF